MAKKARDWQENLSIMRMQYTPEIQDYVDALDDPEHSQSSMIPTSTMEWLLVHASAEQRFRAILKTLEQEKGKTE